MISEALIVDLENKIEGSIREVCLKLLKYIQVLGF